MSLDAYCNLYIDYASLRLKLNENRIFDLHAATLIDNVLEITKRHCSIKRAFAFADWGNLSDQRIFEDQGIETVSILPGRRNATIELQHEVHALLDSYQNPPAVTLVLGDTDYLPILDRLQRSGTKVILCWFKDMVDPRLMNKVDTFISLDEEFNFGNLRASLTLPRKMLLSAALIALDDHMAMNSRSTLPYSACKDFLNNLSYLNGNGHSWLDMAIAEELVILNKATTDAQFTLCSLNDKSAGVQKALETRDRMLLILDLGMRGRPWLSFNFAEKLLRVNSMFGVSEISRRRWIELGISEGLITVQKKIRPSTGAVEPTTVLFLNYNHPISQEIPRLIDNQLRRLIVLCDVFLANHNFKWLAASTVMKILGTFLPPEASQQIFSYARDEGIIRIGKIRDIRNSSRGVSTVELDSDSDLVKKTLLEKISYLSALDDLYSTRGKKLKYHTLSSVLSEAIPPDRVDDIHFWIDLFIRARILRRGSNSSHDKFPSYSFQRSLPAVSLVLTSQ
jgi:hypothetical protein